MIRFLSIGFLATIAVCSTLVFLADPYGLIRPNDRFALSENKYFVTEYEREIKLYLAMHYTARNGLFGTSRVGVGMDPKDMVGTSDASVFNYALNGAKVSEMKALMSAATEGGLENAIIGLDLSSFDTPRTSQSITMEKLRAGDHAETFMEFARRHASSTALRHSLQTLIYNALSKPPSHTRYGLYSGYDAGTPAADIPLTVAKNPPKIPEETYSDFDQLLGDAQEHKVKVTLFFTPAASKIYQADPRYNGWKSRVCEVAKSHGISIKDFSNVAWDEGSGELFVDAGHFNTVIGRRIMNSLRAETATLGCQNDAG